MLFLRMMNLLHFILYSQILCVTSRGFSFPSWSNNAAAAASTSNNKNCNTIADDSKGDALSRDQAQEQVLQFLQDNHDTSAVFHIHGWKWHTMSLAHEADRLHQLASAASQDSARTARVADHVVNFNMKALHKIETDLFFPWMKQQMNSKNPALESAVHVLLHQLDQVRQSVQTAGSQLVSEQMCCFCM